MSMANVPETPGGIPLVLVPGRLEARVHPHQISVGDQVIPCMTAVTSGLAAAGQQEVAMTVVASSDRPEPFPPGLAGYLQVLLSFAEQGRPVGEAGVSGYAPPGPFGFGPFVGVVFTRAEPIPAVPMPPDTLTAVLLTEGELAMAQICPLRVLNSLGQLHRYYPFPWWADPGRTASAYQPADVEQTILSRFPRGGMPDAAATLHGTEAVLTLARADAELLADELAAGRAAAALPGRDPAATGAVVWTPGQTEPTATTADPDLPDQHLTLSFVALVPGDGAGGDVVQFSEDGFAAVLGPASTADLVAVLRRGGQWAVPGAEPYQLRIVAR